MAISEEQKERNKDLQNFRVGYDLKLRMRKNKQINWSVFIRGQIEKRLLEEERIKEENK